jgi:hypothetical protein
VRGAGVEAIDTDRLFSTAAATDFSGAEPAVGDIGAGVVHLGVPYSEHWHLKVDGRDVGHGKSLGWANRFDVDQAGEAHLSYDTAPARWLALVAQLLLWVIACRLARRRPKPVDLIPLPDEVTA